MSRDDGLFQPWVDWTFAEGISADERDAVLAAALECSRIIDFASGAMDLDQSARRLVTVVCDLTAGETRHPHGSAPEIAFVYETSQGLLYQARVARAWDPATDPQAAHGEIGVPMDVHAYLLDRTSPDVLPTKCRRHGQRGIPKSQVRTLAEVVRGSDTPSRLEVPLSRFLPV